MARNRMTVNVYRYYENRLALAEISAAQLRESAAVKVQPRKAQRGFAMACCLAAAAALVGLSAASAWRDLPWGLLVFGIATGGGLAGLAIFHRKRLRGLGDRLRPHADDLAAAVGFLPSGIRRP